MAENSNRHRRNLGRLAGDVVGSDTQKQGYEDAAGVTRAIPGDDEAAFTKMVPFPEQPQPWLANITLPVSGTDAYFSLPAVDVAKFNEINIFLEYQAEAATSGLSIIPEGSLVEGVPTSSNTEQFFRLAALDQAFTAAAIAASGFNETFAQRTLLAQEFRTSVGPTGVQLYVIPIQVTYFKRFRISVADLVDNASTLNVFYARANG